ncbi:bifunctional protein-disulfide isomerase/oxidoreductase DsbC [Conservatibacter flavescens]|uniref:Thiol:disulfide interchange protein n=1 Tax=Conservatibacter flavescens TaxID=28161 RepID=A0A2M8S258_9PAST|nr:bifunctional protein-disulfide isomerase/oxidoreductase DsbC [Conservatibacter flavescens]PJG85232.1 bifunctional protein-disulfide isomerase/oxidoreductase DsbC [Conservatibacter flavescens]
MKKFLTALLILSSATVWANETITSKLKGLGVEEIEIKSSPIKGLKTVITEQGVLYVTDDGKYVLQGSLYELTEKGPVDIGSQFLFEKLNSYQKEMIIYPAKNEKHVVTVFMDITCHYCNLLHKQIKDYNDLGITVRYLAFPRGGMNTQTARQMEAIWTEKDPAFALNEAEKGNMPKNLKTPNIVKKHYDLGVQYGVRGTPSIVTETGEMIGGYLEPKQLLAALEEK